MHPGNGLCMRVIIKFSRQELCGELAVLEAALMKNSQIGPSHVKKLGRKFVELLRDIQINEALKN